MAIYRGPGGPGDAIADADSEAALVSTLVTQAQTAATSASNSATTASTAATTAQGHAASAASSASGASSSASSASSSASSASSSASSASTSATNASTSATNAASSATSASVSASNAATSETNAANSASTASTAATNAANSATAAANSYDAFDDRYLGAKASAPSVDNDGNALLTGALYWNTGSNQLYIWDGSAWDDAAFNTSGALFTTDIGVTVQGYDADLSAIAALSGTSGLLKKTAANTWSLDTNTYLTSYTETDPIFVASPAYGITNTDITEWDTAYTDRLKWDGGSTGLTASTGRTSLGATTLGSNLFTITNPSAITFPRFNADNTVSSLSASDFRTAIGAGTGNGTVTSVGGTGTVNGITLTGTVTSSGNLTLGGTLSGVNLTTQVTGTLPVANGGTGGTTFTANNVLLGNGTSAFQSVAPGTNGNVLTSNGTTWTSAPATGGGITTGKAIAMAIVFG